MHPPAQMGMHQHLSRENIEMRVIHATNALGAFGSRPMLEDQGRDSPPLGKRLTNNSHQSLESSKMFRRQVSERENMGTTEQEQAAFDKLAQRWHHHELLVFINDPRVEALTHEAGKSA